MLVVIDTNILVSALWSKSGAPARILSLIISGGLIPCYDYRILSEYRDVLSRPKFKFTDSEINALLDWIVENGRQVIAEPLNVDFTDEYDKKFYEVAKFCDAKLITGNIKHFPNDKLVLSVPEFLEQYNKRS
ncbi:MAG: putative toxin-antitoxin system toxin component, PIN family [Oscillospiraceae bacterium]|nr:putative toxin-antitoxin system toxin component, PIN family [Oscillospiraceae bacterium]